MYNRARKTNIKQNLKPNFRSFLHLWCFCQTSSTAIKFMDLMVWDVRVKKQWISSIVYFIIFIKARPRLLSVSNCYRAASDVGGISLLSRNCIIVVHQDPLEKLNQPLRTPILRWLARAWVHQRRNQSARTRLLKRNYQNSRYIKGVIIKLHKRAQRDRPCKRWTEHQQHAKRF